MAEERRNLYRILHVQPEAPQEVIKAAYRALMSTLRQHPDLGGDHEQAARLNAAWAVLGDPARRKAYDQSMRRPARPAPGGAPELAPAPDPWSWQADRRCPMCATAFSPGDGHCRHCDSPLTPAPESRRLPGELIGRRRGERVARDVDARVQLPGQPRDRLVRLRDVSLTGLAMVTTLRLAKGQPFRIATPQFDAVAVVVATRPLGAAFTVHARLLTLQLLRAAVPTAAGERVDATA